MADNKGKTKAAMLQELESIKGLLRDEDDIPILQEVITGTGKPHQPTLARHDLDELHTQFQELSQAIAGGSKPSDQLHTQEKAPDTSARLLEAFTRASRHQPTAATSNAPKQQASLFQESVVQEQRAEYTDHPPETDSSASPRDEHPASDEPDRTAPERMQRSPLAKAAGENPFLPQHIRARLHGNNPPPLFDFSASKNLPLPGSKSVNENKAENKSGNSARQRLIQEVIASVLPQLEKELRARLEQLSEQELEQMHESGASR